MSQRFTRFAEFSVMTCMIWLGFVCSIHVTESRGGSLITQLKELLQNRSLNDWEREFILSLVRQAEDKPGFKPSPKQLAIIDRLKARHG